MLRFYLSGKRGVRYRLTWLVMACLLPMLALITFVVADEYQSGREQLIEKSLLTTRAMVLTIDKDLDSVNTALLTLSTSPYLDSGDLAAFQRQAGRVLRNIKANNIYLADSSGQQLINTLRPYGASLPRAGNLALTEKVFHDGQSVVSDLFIGAVSGKPLVAVAVPVKRGDKIIYALSATLDPGRLSEILTDQAMPPDWIVAVYDSSGHFIARTHGIDTLLGKKGAPLLLEHMNKAREGSLENRTVDGTPVVGIFSRSKISNWSILIGIPKKTLNANLWKTIEKIALVSLIILLSTLALAWRLGGKIAQSIHSLIEPALALGNHEKVLASPLYLREADEVHQALERASEILKLTRHLAQHDPLTGLANRSLFNEIVAQQLALCQRYAGNLSILYLDLDGFKSVNDSHGHAIGDVLLRQVAARIQGEVRRSDLVARMGGDEFASVLMNTDRQGATTVAVKLVEALSAPYMVDGIHVDNISTSIGIAVYPEHGQDIEVLMQRADLAMYISKTNGKRGYTVASSDTLSQLCKTEAELSPCI